MTTGELLDRHWMGEIKTWDFGRGKAIAKPGGKLHRVDLLSRMDGLCICQQLHYARSKSTAAPWPPPTHIVTTP